MLLTTVVKHIVDASDSSDKSDRSDNFYSPNGSDNFNISKRFDTVDRMHSSDDAGDFSYW